MTTTAPEARTGTDDVIGDWAAVTTRDGETPIGHLRRQADRLLAQQEYAARQEAARQLGEVTGNTIGHLIANYPATLGALLTEQHFTGFAAWGDREPTAVAHLGDGVWLHYEEPRQVFGSRPVLTLLIPCRCGLGYRLLAVSSQEELLQVLGDLAGEQGEINPDDCLFNCASVRGWDDPPW
jgi:hypothetical protein